MRTPAGSAIIAATTPPAPGAAPSRPPRHQRAASHHQAARPRSGRMHARKPQVPAAWTSAVVPSDHPAPARSPPGEAWRSPARQCHPLAQDLTPPVIQQPTADAVFARNLRRRQVRPKALSHNLALLPEGPHAPPLAAGDDPHPWDTHALTTSRKRVLSNCGDDRRQLVHGRTSITRRSPPAMCQRRTAYACPTHFGLVPETSGALRSEVG